MIRRFTSIFKDLVELKVRRDNVVNKVFPNGASMTYTYRKGTLDESIFTLIIWQQMTDPTWVLMVKLYGDSRTMAPAVSQNFKSYTSNAKPYDWKLELPGQSHPYTRPETALQDLDAMRVSDVPFSPFNIAENKEAGIRIIHKIGPLNPKHFQALGKSVRDLAYRLQHTKPEVFNLLSCEGFYEQYHYGMNLTVIFRAPPDFNNPQSLRDQLISNAEPAPVSERLSVAQELAKALGYAHALGFTHIDVHPENIIRLQTRDKNGSSAFFAALVGATDDSLSPDGEIPLGRSVYRHPSTQYTDAVKVPILQHDIYSLGVCLLEIGLWQSFISYDAHTMRTTLSRITGIADDASQGEVEQFLVKSAKQRFVDLIRNELCDSMGMEYSEIVEMCLTCLDPYNSCSVPCEFETDEYDIQVGVKYTEKVTVGI
jgi:hypothetical protein